MWRMIKYSAHNTEPMLILHLVQFNGNHRWSSGSNGWIGELPICYWGAFEFVRFTLLEPMLLLLLSKPLRDEWMGGEHVWKIEPKCVNDGIDRSITPLLPLKSCPFIKPEVNRLPASTLVQQTPFSYLTSIHIHVQNIIFPSAIQQ